MKTVIILNLQQAEIFARQRMAVDEVVSFCPSATYFLNEKKYNIMSASASYGALSHGKNVVLITRELPRIVEAATQQYGLDYPESTGLRVYLYHYLARVYYLYFSLRGLRARSGDFIWIEDNRLAQGDWRAMFLALGNQPIGAMASYAFTNYSTAHYLLTALYNRIIAACVARSSRLKVIDFGDELPKRIVAAMIKNGDNPLILNTHKVGRNPFLSTRFFLKSLTRLWRARADGLPVLMFRSASPVQYHEAFAECSIPTLSADVVTEVLRYAVTNYIPFARTEVAMGRKIVRALRPHIAVSDHAKYLYILGGLEEVRAQGGQHAMLNHGTHTMQYDRLSHMAAKLWGEQERIINRNTTHSLPKSPLTAMLTREIRPDNDYEICKLNVYGKIENKASREGKFVILQAGNYTDAYNHIPWCKETADEYLLAIIELLEEVGKLDNVELIIKLKNKKSGTHKAIVEGHIARLGIADKARVDTTGKFSEVMARAHIVVCNISGTIEEALANNIPLMIHTTRKSYFHIAEQTVRAAAIGDIAPAYLVKERADIGRIITLLDKHRSELNNPVLYKNVAWQEKELTSIHDFAKDLVDSASKRKATHAS